MNASGNEDTARRSKADARGQGAFFGRRKGPKLRQHQSGLMQSLLPHLLLDIDTPSPQTVSDLFEDSGGGVRLEIGFGGGEHLVAEALANPDTGFIGCEPYVNGMAKILVLIEQHRLRNIRLFAGDALQLLDWLPEGSMTRVDLIHPDPWPKRRHWKRRFVQPRTLDALARVIVARGDFRFVSDIDDYCGWTLARVIRSNLFAWTAERADDWREPWPGFTPTRYGQKAVREGRRASYFIFRKS